MFKKLWDYSGWIVGAYAIYSHIQTLDKLRQELYASLPPEQQARLDEIVGKVKSELPPSLFNQPIIATPIERVQAGA